MNIFSFLLPIFFQIFLLLFSGFSILCPPLYYQAVFSCFLFFLREAIPKTRQVCEMEQSLNGEGTLLGFASERRLALCTCFTLFYLAPGNPGEAFLCLQYRVCFLFLSDRSYCLTAVCGRLQESNLCAWAHVYRPNFRCVCMPGTQSKRYYQENKSLEGIFSYFEFVAALYLLFASWGRISDFRCD